MQMFVKFHPTRSANRTEQNIILFYFFVVLVGQSPIQVKINKAQNKTSLIWRKKQFEPK